MNINNNFYKEGRFLIELFGNSDKNKNEIVTGINNFSLISNKYNNKNKIYNETNFNIVNKDKISILSDINNNNYILNSNNRKNLNLEEKKEDLKIIEKSNLNNIVERKFQTIKVLEKLEKCERKLENKEQRCIKCFSILRNNRILLIFKSGIIKVYEFESNENPNEADKIKLKELLNLQQDEYCFNYCIELDNGNIAICSEDATVKIIKLLFDEVIKKNNENYKI